MINKRGLRKICTEHGVFYWTALGRYGETVRIYSDEVKFKTPINPRYEHILDGGRGILILRNWLNGLSTIVTPKFVAKWLDGHFNRSKST